MIEINAQKSSLTTPSFYESFKDSVTQVTRAIFQTFTGAPAVREQTEAETIGQKHGECWTCISYERGIAGKLFKFKFNDEFFCSIEAFAKKSIEFFPAAEPDQSILEWAKISESKFLQDLGYSFSSEKSGLYLILPDKEELVARFELLRLKYPNLRPLNIISSEGIADDMSFIHAFCHYTLLLSSGKEFIHDHIFHVIPTLLLLLESPEAYYLERERLAGVVSAIYHRIVVVEQAMKAGMPGMTPEKLAKIKTAIAADIDGTWSVARIEDLKKITLDYFDKVPFPFINIWDQSSYQYFWQRRFQGEEANPYELIGIWVELTGLVSASQAYLTNQDPMPKIWKKVF